MVLSENIESADDFLDQLNFDVNGLIPVISQQYDSGEVLMLAWMNKDALQKTIETGDVYYWSRSRKSLWRKGETSGQVQHLKKIIIDCDKDTILALVDQSGVACHTGRETCFFYEVTEKGVEITKKVKVSPDVLYKEANE